jgi:hypothetical protein
MKRAGIVILFMLCAVGAMQAQVGVVRSGGYGISKSAKDLGPMTRNGKVYYYHNTPMTQAEMATFVQQNCEKAYQHYRKNKNIEIAGWSLFGGGAFISAVLGSAMLGAHVSTNKGILQTAAMSLYGAGAIVGITGIPMIIAGNVQKKNTHKVFNTWCGYKELETSRLELKLTSGENGIGLALAF